ncbi:GNAT family N-acetyltransferase [Youxingia wuxianensis]|uniref:GNAT family N-acetyltransferase n=1 Tax=Youxingia wuxianensis TaxID=2763678 RepID=A0A926ETM2_9FIRM|nr:GNAT family N-acetyltransferase [Youxingia wuxianensis]MBC8586264.1 GNAT family N-acetyltransferase [Youxingia wuxianensis]
MLRPFRAGDEQAFYDMAQVFHNSDAVIHKTPLKHFQDTFQAVIEGSPFVKGYLLEQDGKTAGYGLAFVTYSNEGGGLMYTWDEIYVDPAFRGHGLGTEFITHMEQITRESASVFRLECEDSNTRAVQLYKRLGYRPVHYRQLVKFIEDTPAQPGDITMVRPFAAYEEETFYRLAREYHASGVMDREAPFSHFKNTFREVVKGSPYIQGYFILNEGVPVGYALVCPTYSNEAGGMLITLDELFILPAFRGRGLGSGFMRYYENRYAQGSAMYRVQVVNSDKRSIDYLTKKGYEYLEYFELLKPVEK